MAMQSAADTVRSFWTTKTRDEPATSNDNDNNERTFKESPSMGGLRTSLARTKSWEKAKAMQRQSVEIPSNVVAKNIFLQRDRTPSPATTPEKHKMVKVETQKPPEIVRDAVQAETDLSVSQKQCSPIRSSMASPEPKTQLSRQKSVTFNESPEVREMSDCSFDTTSSIYSSVDDDNPHPEHSHYTTAGIIEDNSETMSETPRTFSNVPASRPLPTVPAQRAQSPVQKVLATEQENMRKTLTGLGLQLGSNELHRDDMIYSADGSSIRSEVEQRYDLVTGRNIETPEPEMHLAQAPIVPSMSDECLTPQPSTPKARSYIPTRSPSPSLTRENIKAKVAERRAQKEAVHKIALEPSHALAPPVPHSSVSDTTSTTEDDDQEAIPQRKVSDIMRPSTPVAQIQDSAQKPQSAKFLHHERLRRLSIELTEDHQKDSTMPVSMPVINYDGDHYDQEENVKPVELDVKEYRRSSIASCESPLRQLPEIPEAPQRRDLDDGTTDDDYEEGNDSHFMQIRDTTSSSLLEPISLDLDFTTFGADSLGLEQYMTPEKRPETPITSRTVLADSPTKVTFTPSKLDAFVDMTARVQDPVEPATITSRGTKLRTRPSLTPADAAALAARRRQVSAEMEKDTEMKFDSEDEDAVMGKVKHDRVHRLASVEISPHLAHAGLIEVGDGTPPPLVQPVLGPLVSDMSFADINSAFDRVMQRQKKSYVIVERSEVVHASGSEAGDDQEIQVKGHNRQASSITTNASTRAKQTENFRSHHRRQSSKIPNGVTLSPKPQSVPHSPFCSNSTVELDGGRLFVKVTNVNNLTLPIPNGEESFFSCTLDNGKHCVTTPWHTLAKKTRIDQEFELIADHDLEFVLTLQAKYEPPTTIPKPKTTLSRLLHSPKRHRTTGSITSFALAGHVGIDGSFARAHVALKHFRDKAFGRPHCMSISVLNEWAVEMTSAQGAKHPHTRLRKPYKIGDIEMVVLYVPPVALEARNTLPTSLSLAVRAMKDAEWHLKSHVSGYLSQQGGDCPYWRRRQFRLQGAKLTAYHIATNAIRATINLSKAVSVTDDKESLIMPEVTIGRGDQKKRRRSGFAEREEGHLYVAEGFRIRFQNGEVIDFYADSINEKERWMTALHDIIGHVPALPSWCQRVFEFEGQAMAPASSAK